MRPQEFMTRLDASRSVRLCPRQLQEYHAGSSVFLWIRFGPGQELRTVLTGIDTAPFRAMTMKSL